VTIVGEPTFGANGDVSRIKLPGGYLFVFTGMIVTTHAGERIHAKGFQPDVPVTPTIEGIRAGRDEVLERAVEVAISSR
jgi:C-terminal processing protease CtpA/Prc